MSKWKYRNSRLKRGQHATTMMALCYFFLVCKPKNPFILNGGICIEPEADIAKSATDCYTKRLREWKPRRLHSNWRCRPWNQCATSVAVNPNRSNASVEQVVQNCNATPARAPHKNFSCSMVLLTIRPQCSRNPVHNYRRYSFWRHITPTAYDKRQEIEVL